MTDLEHFQKYLRYEATTGNFYWIKVRSSRVQVGQLAGTLNTKGYRVIYVCGQLYYAHRLAWLFVKGEWPSQQIDHINRDKRDNRIENLRDVPNRVNHQNRKPRELPIGVHRSGCRWIARINIKCKSLHLGTFKSPEDAYMAYFAACKELGF